jgi:hypothetical protein
MKQLSRMHEEAGLGGRHWRPVGPGGEGELKPTEMVLPGVF